ncbi:unnamed protein product [Enterobius vermicularis]|uniref:Uncharacterized protein n=1 Tax=Enterobius vermicularis TaxID=51028 RepID=A0A0N4VRD7_ENTVE|nr:unnamed protein product [Enterobius vermicularis]
MHKQWFLQIILTITVVYGEEKIFRTKRYSSTRPNLWTTGYNNLPNEQYGAAMILPANHYPDYTSSIQQQSFGFPTNIFPEGYRPTHSDIEAYTKNAAVETNRHRALAAHLGLPSLLDSTVDRDSSLDRLLANPSVSGTREENKSPILPSDGFHSAPMPISQSSITNPLNRFGGNSNIGGIGAIGGGGGGGGGRGIFGDTLSYNGMQNHRYPNDFLKGASSFSTKSLFSKTNPSNFQYLNAEKLITPGQRPITGNTNRYERLHVPKRLDYFSGHDTDFRNAD